MEAQLRTDPLIRSEENQHASGAIKSGFIYSLFFFRKENTHAHMSTSANTSARVHMPSSLQHSHIHSHIHKKRMNREIHTST